MSRSRSITEADEKRLETYLRRQAADGGPEVEKWSYTNATTWRVRADDRPRSS